MDINALVQAVQGQTAGAVPSSNPLGSDMFAELASANAAGVALPRAQGASTGADFNAQVDAQAAREGAARAAAAKKRELEAMLNPDNYTMKQKDDGGFDFFDPNGKQIDIATFAKIKGVRPVDVIAKSQNPIDVQYAQDYDNLEKFMQAVTSKDKTKVAEFTANEPALKKYTTGKGGLDRLLQDFRNTYKRYYTPRSADPNAWGARPGGRLVPSGGASSGGGVADQIRAQLQEQ